MEAEVEHKGWMDGNAVQDVFFFLRFRIGRFDDDTDAISRKVLLKRPWLRILI